MSYEINTLTKDEKLSCALAWLEYALDLSYVFHVPDKESKDFDADGKPCSVCPYTKKCPVESVSSEQLMNIDFNKQIEGVTVYDLWKTAFDSDYEPETQFTRRLAALFLKYRADTRASIARLPNDNNA